MPFSSVDSKKRRKKNSYGLYRGMRDRVVDDDGNVYTIPAGSHIGTIDYDYLNSLVSNLTPEEPLPPVQQDDDYVDCDVGDEDDNFPLSSPTATTQEQQPSGSNDRINTSFYDSNSKDSVVEHYAQLYPKLAAAYLRGVGWQEPDPRAIRLPDAHPCHCAAPKKYASVLCVFKCVNEDIKYGCIVAIRNIDVEYCDGNCERRSLPLALMEQHMLPTTPSATKTAIHLSVASIVEWLTVEHEDSKVPLPKSIESLVSNQPARLPMPHMWTEVEMDVEMAMTPNGDRMVIAMDGNMSLRRFDRVKSHQSLNDPTIPLVKKYWAADDDIIEKPVKSSDGCESWRALKKPSTRSKIALDVKGVYGATCSHDFPLAFMNIKTLGERMLGSYYNAPMAVSVFHVYGHEAKCQAKYHPYTLAGFGLRDGENLEHLWSYLGGFSSTTRYMSPENRQLVLTLGLDHYASKKFKKIGHTLLQRWKRAMAVCQMREWGKLAHGDPIHVLEHCANMLIMDGRKCVPLCLLYDIAQADLWHNHIGYTRSVALAKAKEAAASKVKKAVEAYKKARTEFLAVAGPNERLDTPGELDPQNVLSPNSKFRETTDILSANDKPFAAFHKRNRALEEMRTLQDEAANVIRYGEEYIETITEGLDKVDIITKDEDEGTKRMMQTKKAYDESIGNFMGIDSLIQNVNEVLDAETNVELLEGREKEDELLDEDEDNEGIINKNNLGLP
ncbi:hypothetical protein INT45_007726 [Circinella minor]|uniref:Uncharacterized protein n=1 Tax=Circinella minor TaxID=1195481 RepID=A0A8H7VCS4_9FUNG|nr:hypothetical protein INT45_007726 [Circinella minor]